MSNTRVDSADVKEIIDTELDDVSMFITTANILVTKLLGDSDLENDHLAEIEKYLAAHFVAIRDPSAQRIVSEKIGDAEVRYQAGSMTYSNSMKDASGLNETSYGKQVIIIDTTGILKEKLGKVKSSMEVVG